MTTGLYIHIPFCQSRCIYCGFYSTINMQLQSRYVDALIREMTLRRNEAKGNISTIYLGGGTPSTLSFDDLHRLFIYIYKVYDVCPDAEITMECNPDDVTNQWTERIKTLPINRISMGVQTFSDTRLRFLHRRHNAQEAKDAVQRLREAGISNISIDLMFGFPEQTVQEWTKDIHEALQLSVEHISAYSLMYEEDTALWQMREKGKVNEINDETSVEMYSLLTQQLKEAGYEHYEISNFALPGFRSRHNGSYWRQIPYIGLGAAAHSYDGHSRQWNVADIERYISSIEHGQRPYEQEALDTDTTFNDIITTALRTCEGIDLNAMQQQLGAPYVNQLKENSQKHIHNGLMQTDGKRIWLTHQGILISDMIMSDLMIV